MQRQARSSGAQRRPRRGLVRAARGTRQQQAGDVGRAVRKTSATVQPTNPCRRASLNSPSPPAAASSSPCSPLRETGDDGVTADAERDGEQQRGGQARSSTQAPHRIAEIAQERQHERNHRPLRMLRSLAHDARSGLRQRKDRSGRPGRGAGLRPRVRLWRGCLRDAPHLQPRPVSLRPAHAAACGSRPSA